ncbi:MAG: Holliday junction resolvase-like protein [Candidatus Diapherotrites archaeon]|nr:Holliday junction resolvase-like protein [Candidatus Diapherotrites archaeon]
MAFAAVLFVLVVWLFSKANALQRRLDELAFSKSSQSVKYGKLTEQWIPFSDKFPFDANKFRFLGNPIDGVAFLDDRVVFCEFKTASSTLSETQKRIKKLVLDKKVEWTELKIR